MQFKVEELIKVGYFFQLFSLSQRFWLAEKLRSHVTITLRDKSRYDLIVEMSQSFVGGHVWSTWSCDILNWAVFRLEDRFWWQCTFEWIVIFVEDKDTSGSVLKPFKFYWNPIGLDWNLS